jgi:hypothetical protein
MQDTLVYLIVLCAALVSFRRYAPTPWRRALDERMRRIATRFGWKTSVHSGNDSACGGCDSGSTTKASTGAIQRISADSLKRTIRPRNQS